MKRKAALWLGAGVGVGAGVMYLLDPDRGRRRRARMRDQLVHTTHEVTQGAGTVSRDVAHRTRGLVVGPRAWFTRAPVDDVVLVERIRSQLGRVVSHPHAIQVSAEEGNVTLTGAVLAEELRPLLRHLRHVRGVNHIEQQLQVHDGGEHVPGLQGGRRRPGLRRRPPFSEHSWSPAERFLAGLGATAAIGYGLGRRDGVGLASIGVGALLAGRTAGNRSLRHMVGLGHERETVETRKTLRVAAPLEHVYAIWSGYEAFPRFMAGVTEVSRLDDTHLRWRLKGPLGLRLRWDSIVTAEVPNELIAWRTAEGSFMRHSGVVRFRPNGDENHTLVEVTLTYHPPAGMLGRALASMMRLNPKTRLDAELLRMKTFMETGTLPHDAARPAGQASA
ncbi:MAG TPA: SRPBCC family protein [Gammaproteobacteria bacterium]|nr:SRPBCC family protein [Gammaproteobacteria bacterium]